MKRNDKIKAVRRYLVAATGIPGIYWDGVGNALDAPDPYDFVVSTDASLSRFFERIKAGRTDKMPFVIRYDSYLNEVDRSVVGMPLSTFAPLLQAHYQAGDNHNREGD